MSKNMFIRRHTDENGKDGFAIYYIVDATMNPAALPLCILPTLEQACSLVRFINGGNMNRSEREAIMAALHMKGGRQRRE